MRLLNEENIAKYFECLDIYENLHKRHCIKMNMLVFVSEMNEQLTVFLTDDVMRLTFFYQYHSLDNV